MHSFCKGFENFSRSKNKEKIIDKENREEENIIFVENKGTRKISLF